MPYLLIIMEADGLLLRSSGGGHIVEPGGEGDAAVRIVGISNDCAGCCCCWRNNPDAEGNIPDEEGAGPFADDVDVSMTLGGADCGAS